MGSVKIACRSGLSVASNSSNSATDRGEDRVCGGRTASVKPHPELPPLRHAELPHLGFMMSIEGRLRR